MKVLTAALTLLLAVVNVHAAKETFIEVAVHSSTTAEQRVLAWSTVNDPGMHSYEIFLYSIDRQQYNYYAVVTQPDPVPEKLQHVFTIPKTGLYKIKIRARRKPDQIGFKDAVKKCEDMACVDDLAVRICGAGDWYNSEGLSLEEAKDLIIQRELILLCSEFNDSTDAESSLVIDPDTLEEIPRGWLLYGYPAPPGAVIIDQTPPANPVGLNAVNIEE